MIIFDNIVFALQKVGGISNVWQNLLEELTKLKIQFNVIEYPGSDNNLFRKSLKINNKNLIQHKFRLSGIIEQMLDVHVKGVNSKFIFHSSYYRICDNPLAVNITTVHDFTYESGFSKIGLSEKIRIWLNHRAIKRSDHIVCISENTKRDLIRYIPQIDENKISVIYNGVSEDYYPVDDKIKDLSNSILFVGGRQDYKNFKFAVNVAKSSNLHLIICGNALSEKEKNLLDKTLGEDGFTFKLRPENKDLNKIYNSVKCLLYPSSYEGFGIPILEAQRAGCPVIALKISSIPEVMGDTGLMMKNLDEKEAITLINNLNDNNHRSKVISEGLENAARFSWKRMAEEYADLYDKLLNRYEL